jgi:hypothetical protein
MTRPASTFVCPAGTSPVRPVPTTRVGTGLGVGPFWVELPELYLLREADAFCFGSERSSDAGLIVSPFYRERPEGRFPFPGTQRGEAARAF